MLVRHGVRQPGRRGQPGHLERHAHRASSGAAEDELSPPSRSCWGIGIAWRPTVRVALAASIVWALGVWWFGEGLGMVLTNRASPVNGAPGLVILYALLAVLLWPADRPGDAAALHRGPRGGSPGGPGAVAGALAQPGLLRPAPRQSGTAGAARHDRRDDGSGEPGWLGALDRGAASLLVHQGLTASVVLAIALVIVAAGVYLPTRYAKSHPDPGHRDSRGDLGVRRGLRDHSDRRRAPIPTQGPCLPCWRSPTGRPGPPSRRRPALSRLRPALTKGRSHHDSRPGSWASSPRSCL